MRPAPVQGAPGRRRGAVRACWFFLAKVFWSNSRYTGVLIRALCLTVAVPALLAGCAAMPHSVRRAMTKPYEPANVSVRQPGLPGAIRRVVLLPLPKSRDDANQAAGVDALAGVLLDQLRHRKLFELITISREDLQSLTGRPAWAAEEALPHDFFERLRQSTGCDGVIFASLTVYRAYPPLVTGWKARLVDCREHQTWWAVDEVFDAGADPVAVAAEAYAQSAMNLPNPLLDGAGVLQSPLRFGEYTANAIASTLPKR
jgi:hypothetical protein